MFEQWEDFIQHLTQQPVRQATVKTADDRMAVIWPEMVKEGGCSEDQLEEIIKACMKRQGNSFHEVSKKLIKPSEVNKNNIFSN